MDKPLFDLLDSCTVHLKFPGGTGTGFFVAPGLVLTCAHVVERARDDMQTITVRNGDLEHRVQEILEILPDPYTDLALVRIDLRDHPCVFLDKSVKPPDRLYTYGYATQSYTSETRTVSQATTVEYEGETRIDNQRWLLRFKGGQIIRGYSGSPLLNMRTWGVCGIVKSTRDPGTDLGGGGIPAEIVFLKLPDLAQRNQAFHARDPRWERARAQQEAFERRERPLVEAGAYDAALYERAENKRKPERLYGRQNLIGEVDRLLDESQHVVLAGFGGTGKTALAATIADARIEDGKGPVLWLRAGSDDADTLFEAIATCLQAKEELDGVKGDAKIKAVRALLSEAKVGLLVLDDMRRGRALAQVRPAIPEGLPTLVTSRQNLENVDTSVMVTDLSPDDALELLAHHAHNDRISDEGYRADPASRQLCAKLGYHALGLVIAGGWLRQRKRKASALLERIKKRRLTPPTIPMPASFVEEGRETVKMVLDETFYEFDDATQEVLKAFGALFEPRATMGLLAAYIEAEDELALEDALDALVAWNFVKREGASYYDMHDMVHSYAEAVSYGREDPDRRPIISAVLRYVTQHAQEFDNLQLDQPNILGAAAQADDEIRLEIMRTLTLDGYFNKRGHTLGFLEQLDKALNFLVAREDRGELNAGQLEMLHYLLGKRGDAYFDRGDYGNAVKAFQHSFDLASDARRRVIMSGIIGRTASFRGDHDAARQYFEQAHQLARELEDDFLLSYVLEQEAWAAGHNGDHATARQIATEQVAINERLLEARHDSETLEGLAISLINLGTAELRLAKQGIHKALSFHQRAARIAEELGDDLYRARTLWALGEDYHTLGERDKAWEYLSEARVLFRSWGSVTKEETIVKFMREYGYDEIERRRERNMV